MPAMPPTTPRHLIVRRPRSWAALAGWVAAVLLTACQMRGDYRPLSSELPPPPQLVPVPDQCQVDGARFAIGRPMTAPLMEEMRMRAGARLARTALPNEPPQPNDPNRLSIDIEPDGRIVGLRCG